MCSRRLRLDVVVGRRASYIHDCPSALIELSVSLAQQCAVVGAIVVMICRLCLANIVNTPEPDAWPAGVARHTHPHMEATWKSLPRDHDVQSGNTQRETKLRVHNHSIGVCVCEFTEPAIACSRPLATTEIPPFCALRFH